jgi:hypothetical protein
MSPLSGRKFPLLFLLFIIGTYTGSAFGQQAPSLPKAPQLPKVEAPKLPSLPKDTAVKTKLLQRIANALKFTKNARANERERIVTIINSMFADSMVTTQRDIQQLNNELSLQDKQHFDTLISLIQTLSAQRLADSTAIAQGLSAAVSGKASDQDINELANKLLPLLQPKPAPPAEDPGKLAALADIRAFYGHDPNRIDTLRLNDSIGQCYRLQLAHRAMVVGIHPFWMEDRYMNYNFASLDALSFYGVTADGSTGKIRNTLSPGSFKALSAAKKAGCNTQLTIYDTDIKNVAALFLHEQQQYAYIDSLLPVLQQQGATGVNIWFKSVSHADQNNFTRFVKLLSGYLNHQGQHYTIAVTLPAYDQQRAYDLRALDTLCDYFYIDFTQRPATTVAGPMASLNEVIKPAVNRYVNMNISPGKFVLLLSYQGIRWDISGRQDKIAEVMPYDAIRKRYPSDTAILFDADVSAAFADDKDADGNVVGQTWFDDAASLGAKYDYVLASKLGGVALWPMGADDGYTDLWDELTYKFTYVDTVRLDMVRLLPPVHVPLTFWQRVKTRFFFEARMLGLLMRSPCSVHAYEYNSDMYFLYLTIFFLICTLVAGGYYAYHLRKHGSNWPARRKFLWAFIILMVLTLMCGVMELWLSKHIPWLGITDDPKECHPVTLVNVAVAFAVGITIGMIIMRTFVFPLIRKDNMP